MARVVAVVQRGVGTGRVGHLAEGAGGDELLAEVDV